MHCKKNPDRENKRKAKSNRAKEDGFIITVLLKNCI